MRSFPPLELHKKILNLFPLPHFLINPRKKRRRNLEFTHHPHFLWETEGKRWTNVLQSVIKIIETCYTFIKKVHKTLDLFKVTLNYPTLLPFTKPEEAIWGSKDQK